jgi:hypothetical protein
MVQKKSILSKTVDAAEKSILSNTVDGAEKVYSLTELIVQKMK